ncbi:unnamed protein product [Toxocara canis]|uniref:Uncharacterized protein n=1 Tax=Toxocara canis TaxID=6265 RepID=A0A183U6G9_TOXCA|nr:unnamed protein product [Toxocara canis]
MEFSGFMRRQINRVITAESPNVEGPQEYTAQGRPQYYEILSILCPLVSSFATVTAKARRSCAELRAILFHPTFHIALASSTSPGGRPAGAVGFGYSELPSHSLSSSTNYAQSSGTVVFFGGPYLL